MLSARQSTALGKINAYRAGIGVNRMIVVAIDLESGAVLLEGPAAVTIGGTVQIVMEPSGVWEPVSSRG